MIDCLNCLGLLGPLVDDHLVDVTLGGTMLEWLNGPHPSQLGATSWALVVALTVKGQWLSQQVGGAASTHGMTTLGHHHTMLTLVVLTDHATHLGLVVELGLLLLLALTLLLGNLDAALLDHLQGLLQVVLHGLEGAVPLDARHVGGDGPHLVEWEDGRASGGSWGGVLGVRIRVRVRVDHWNSVFLLLEPVLIGQCVVADPDVDVAPVAVGHAVAVECHDGAPPHVMGKRMPNDTILHC